MKKYIVVAHNDILTSVSHEFDTKQDAFDYAKIMQRNEKTLSSGKPMWNYHVYQLIGE